MPKSRNPHNGYSAGVHDAVDALSRHRLTFRASQRRYRRPVNRNEIGRLHAQRAVPCTLDVHESQPACRDCGDQVALCPYWRFYIQRIERPDEPVVPDLRTPRSRPAQRNDRNQLGVVPIGSPHNDRSPLHHFRRLESTKVADQHHPGLRLKREAHPSLCDFQPAQASRKSRRNYRKLDRVAFAMSADAGCTPAVEIPAAIRDRPVLCAGAGPRRLELKPPG